MNTKERIKEIIKANGIKSVSQFEKSISVGNGYVNNIRSDISPEVRDKILEVYPLTNRAFLVFGEGNPLIDHPDPAEYPDQNKTIQNLAEALLKANSSNEKLVEQNGKVLDRILLSLDALVLASSAGPRIGVGLGAATDQVLGKKEPQTKEQSLDTQKDTSQNKDS